MFFVMKFACSKSRVCSAFCDDAAHAMRFDARRSGSTRGADVCGRSFYISFL
jgi:hypothetical protein